MSLPARTARRYHSHSFDDDLLQVYPTIVTACAVRVALFSWRFIIPLVIFVFCYWKIISTLRRRAMVGVAQRQRQQQQQPAAGPSTSTATSSRHSKPPSKTQKNVIKTMVVVISFFIFCYLPIQFTIVLQFCGLRISSYMALYNTFGVITFFNFCADPFIYATGMYQFLTANCVAVLRRLVRGENRVSNVPTS